MMEKGIRQPFWQDLFETKMKNILPLLLAIGALNCSCSRTEPTSPTHTIMNPTETKSATTNKTELADLGGGCFWCLDYFLCVFDQFMTVKNHAANFAATK